MYLKPRHFLLAVLAAALLLGMNAAAEHNTREALEARVAPEGELNVVAANVVSQPATSAAADGAAVHNATCVACHGGGIAGAPKTGDAEAWQGRIAQGMAVLVAHAIDGFQGDSGVMLPKGGNAALSDDEVAAAVAYMVEQSR